MHICWLVEMLLVNTYMLIELWMLLVISYMSSDGELLVNTHMLNDWWMNVIGELHVGELFVWTYALLLSHMFMHTWLMVTDFYIQIVRRVWNLTYDVFVASGWRPCWWWYRMHLGIMYRRIVHPCMSLICICVWWMNVIGELHVDELFVWTYALLLSHMFMHTRLMVTDFISKM